VQWRLSLVRDLAQLAFDLAQHSAQHGTLALEHAAQTLKLFGMRVATGASA
jgi:hypothetical protein